MQHVLNGSSKSKRKRKPFFKKGDVKGVVALKKIMKIGLPLTK